VVFADDNIFGGSLHSIKKTTEALVFASKEIGVEVIEIRMQDEVTI
jgi:hypothetical protein